MLEASWDALLMMLDPLRFFFLCSGVVLGLILGILPGIGGLTGMALLLPFTFTMDPHTAFGFLLGLTAVTHTSDTIPSVLFGVPGTVSSQATVLDGYAMAQKGEAGRALAAAYTASLIGGLSGAAMLGLTIPLLRPVMLYIGTPELLAFAIFGISMVAVLSGNAPLRGLTAGGLGVLLSMIGTDPQTSTLRWTLDSLYLWDGLPLLPMVLGIFAMPEICDLAIKRKSVAAGSLHNIRVGMLRGVRDALSNWFLVIRCGALGSIFGAIPGIGGSVIDWLAYGHALRSERGAQQTFGTGDVRGVIAPESANNAQTGGTLVPTVAFGVPGSASMAIVLGAFLIQGLVPGPQMLAENLAVTYSMVWSIAIANILGAGICFSLSGVLAKLATLRQTLIVPAIISVMAMGAFQATRSWGDLYTLLIFGVVGWTMKQLKWPRPPLVLGFVLGATIERYMFISMSRMGYHWLLNPIVIVLLALALLSLLRPLLQSIGELGGVRRAIATFRAPVVHFADLFTVGAIVLVCVMLYQATGWPYPARIGPLIVGCFTLVIAGLSLVGSVFRRPAEEVESAASKAVGHRIHMDSQTDMSALSRRTILRRAAAFLAWLVAFVASMWVVGILATTALLVIGYMRIGAKEGWFVVLAQAILLTLLVYIVFDQLLATPWPQTLIGQWLPALRSIPSI